MGVVANPASGRDIRRLVAGASVFGNADKAGMVFRLLAGLGAAGVERVLMMPAGRRPVERRCTASSGRRTARADRGAPFPELEELDMRARRHARATARAPSSDGRRGRRARSSCSAATAPTASSPRRAATCRSARSPPAPTTSSPRCARRRWPASPPGWWPPAAAARSALRREAGAGRRAPTAPSRDLALVDVAVSRERFVGARALWRAERRQRAVRRPSPNPGAVGLSAIAGLLAPLARGAGAGCTCAWRRSAAAESRCTSPLAPGLVTPVGVAEHRALEPGEAVAVAAGAGHPRARRRARDRAPPARRGQRPARPRVRCASTSTP